MYLHSVSDYLGILNLLLLNMFKLSLQSKFHLTELYKTKKFYSCSKLNVTFFATGYRVCVYFIVKSSNRGICEPITVLILKEEEQYSRPFLQNSIAKLKLSKEEDSNKYQSKMYRVSKKRNQGIQYERYVQGVYTKTLDLQNLCVYPP